MGHVGRKFTARTQQSCEVKNGVDFVLADDAGQVAGIENVADDVGGESIQVGQRVQVKCKELIAIIGRKSFDQGLSNFAGCTCNENDFLRMVYLRSLVMCVHLLYLLTDHTNIAEYHNFGRRSSHFFSFLLRQQMRTRQDKRCRMIGIVIDRLVLHHHARPVDE